MERAALALLVAVVAAVSIAHLVYYLPRTVDDLFISLRYARNLVSGHGLVYNVGERVEGFSSPLWVLLQAAGMGLGIEGVLWTKLLGLTSFVALVAGIHVLGTRTLGTGPAWSLVACLAVALQPFVVSWSVLGLETPAFLALVVWMVVLLHACARLPTGRVRAALVVVTLALAAARPEAPLFVAAAWAAFAVERDARGRLRVLLPLAAIVVAVSGLLVGARVVYYGDLLPHTAYAKTGDPEGLSVLLDLVGRGCTAGECAMLAGGLAIAVAMARARQGAAILAVMAADLVFAAAVTRDWMPNGRFLLPLTVLAPLAWCWLGRRLWSARLPAGLARVLPLAVLALLAWAAVPLALTDTRYSPVDVFHNDGRWNRPKSVEALRTSLDCLVHREPDQVRNMSVHAMGLVDQVFLVLEASGTRLEDSWYAGRDIGRVGYYTGVKVFEQDGLFTRLVVRDPVWRSERRPGRALLGRMLALRPVATDLADAWPRELGRNLDLLGGFVVAKGLPFMPFDVRPAGQGRPYASVVLARYEALVDMMPSGFYMQTLYGEAVGAAVEKRARFVRQVLSRGGPCGRDEVPGGLPGAGVTFGDGEILLHGCGLTDARIAPGGETYLECYYEALRRPERDEWLFVHVEGPQARWTADHLPLMGLLPMSDWQPGTIVRDVEILNPALDTPAGSYHVLVGIFLGGERKQAAPPDLTDGQDRAIGPELVVVP